VKTSISLTIKVACLGALSFWAPDIAVHAIRRNLFGPSDVLALTVTMPLILFVCWTAAVKYLGMSAKAIATRMLLGIWLLGGLAMTAGASFCGGGFAGPNGVKGTAIVIGMSLLPIYTFIMATYDGSLGALLVVTVILFITMLLPFSHLKTRPRMQA
jgi:hypothetical protein